MMISSDSNLASKYRHLIKRSKKIFKRMKLGVRVRPKAPMQQHNHRRSMLASSPTLSQRGIAFSTDIHPSLRRASANITLPSLQLPLSPSRTSLRVFQVYTRSDARVGRRDMPIIGIPVDICPVGLQLLDMPLTIRRRILFWALHPKKGCITNGVGQVSVWPNAQGGARKPITVTSFPGSHWGTKSMSNIFLICKQLHLEAQDVLYKEFVFQICLSDAAESNDWLHHLSKFALDNISRLELSVVLPSIGSLIHTQQARIEDARDIFDMSTSIIATVPVISETQWRQDWADWLQDKTGMMALFHSSLGNIRKVKLLLSFSGSFYNDDDISLACSALETISRIWFDDHSDIAHSTEEDYTWNVEDDDDRKKIVWVLDTRGTSSKPIHQYILDKALGSINLVAI